MLTAELRNGASWEQTPFPGRGILTHDAMKIAVLLSSCCRRSKSSPDVCVGYLSPHKKRSMTEPELMKAATKGDVKRVKELVEGGAGTVAVVRAPQ